MAQARRTQAAPDGGGSSAGFIAIDALVALLVLSMGLIIVFRTQSLVTTGIGVATEQRRALAEAELRLETEWPRLAGPGAVSGRSNNLVWSVASSVAGPSKLTDVAICNVRAEVRVEGAKRPVSLSTRRLCHIPGPPHG